MRTVPVRWASAFLLVALVAMVSGCVPKQASRADQGLVWGYVASPQTAQMIVNPQTTSVLSVNFSKVVAPDSAWIVVYEDDRGLMGRQLGKYRVGPGVTEGVEIPIEPTTSSKVFAMMHLDRGIPNVFEFDEQRKDESADRPVFVNETELVVPLTLRSYGVKAAPGTARIAVYRQGSITETLTVGELRAPADSWVVVQLEQQGRPGKVIGLAHVPAGQLFDLAVALQTPDPQQNLFVTLFADSGVVGQFEYDPKSPLTSADQPYYVGGEPVVAKVPVTPK